jgi:hypothetical protein
MIEDRRVVLSFLCNFWGFFWLKGNREDEEDGLEAVATYFLVRWWRKRR